MIRHIKVKCRIVDSETCEFTVLEQTHRNKEFGENLSIYSSTSTESQFIHGDLALVSGGYPDYYIDTINGFVYEGATVSHAVYLLGRTKDTDSYKVNMPLSVWPLLKAAIEAYNEHYSE